MCQVKACFWSAPNRDNNVVQSTELAKPYSCKSLLACAVRRYSIEYVFVGDRSRARETVQGTGQKDRQGKTAEHHCTEDGTEETVAGE